MRKNLLILPAMVVAMGLTSCGKNITREEALTFVKENYKKTQVKTTTSINVSWNFERCKGDKAIGIAKLWILDITNNRSNALAGNVSIENKDEQVPINPLNESTFDYYCLEDCKYSLKGKELTLTSTEKAKDQYDATGVLTFNSDGYYYYDKTTITSYKIDEDNILTGTTELRFSF